MIINKLNSESCIDIPNIYKIGKSKKIFDIKVLDELTELLLEIFNNNNNDSLNLDNSNTNYEKEKFQKNLIIKILIG